jgi:hypothetical protein
VVVKEVALVGVEAAGLEGFTSPDSHSGHRFGIGDRGNQHLAIVAEGDEAAIEEMIDGWGEQEPIRACEEILLTPSTDKMADSMGSMTSSSITSGAAPS